MIKELIHTRIFFPLGKAEVTTKEDLLCPNFCQTTVTQTLALTKETDKVYEVKVSKK